MKEPRQVALRVSRNESLQVVRIGIVFGPVSMQSVLQSRVANQVAQHPPHQGGFAAIENFLGRIS